MNRTLDLASSFAASVLRLGAGMRATRPARRPEASLELYEFEACPFCRKVREALSALDLDATIYPCPRGGTRFRPLVAQKGGRSMFPYLVDPNSGRSMYESEAIIDYLCREYGDGKRPLVSLGPLTSLSAGLASAARLGAGRAAVASKAPAEPLELWSFEASPYGRLAREALCRLELPYRLHNVPAGGRGREAFVARSGKMRVPYLVDPNTGSSMFESGEIVRYLEKTYAVTPVA